MLPGIAGYYGGYGIFYGGWFIVQDMCIVCGGGLVPGVGVAMSLFVFG